jgi:hypothetical protein
VFAAAPTEQFLRLEVRDTGVGIRKAELGLLFKPFEQLHSGNAATGVTGSGLGLSLCKRTIELMGGRVGATSELGKGSTFFFEVPLRGSGREVASGSVQASHSIGNTRLPPEEPSELRSSRGRQSPTGGELMHLWLTDFRLDHAKSVAVQPIKSSTALVVSPRVDRQEQRQKRVYACLVAAAAHTAPLLHLWLTDFRTPPPPATPPQAFGGDPAS